MLNLWLLKTNPDERCIAEAIVATRRQTSVLKEVVAGLLQAQRDADERDPKQMFGVTASEMQ